jgi:alanine racemase
VTDRFERASNRATRALIDLDAITGNVRAVRRVIAPETKLMAVVKANAYGHGARMVAETALAAGADWLGVATLDEALVLRAHGIRSPIQVLGPIVPEEIDDAARNQVEISAGSLEFIDALARHPTPISVHLKIDTGLRRFGVTPDEALAAMTRLSSIPGVVVAGVFSHFGQADECDAGPTNAQHAAFQTCLDAFRTHELPAGLIHAANSAGLLRGRDYDRLMVRLGISLYGIAPSPAIALLPGMRPAMTLVSRVQRVFTLASGDGVSYGATFRAVAPMKAALIPIGYADGYLRSLSNRGEMSINGFSAPVLGRVCMDQTVVGLAANVEVVVNNEVIVAGGEGPNGVPFEDVATRAGTNAYEIVTAVSARVPRVYLRDGTSIAVEDLMGLHRFA